MRKYLLFGLTVGLLWGQSMRGQVTLVLQVPPAGVMLKPQLWNMALVNSSAVHNTITVSITLLSSRPVTLHKGTNTLNARDLGPIIYNYLPSSLTVDRDPDGFMPVGNFRACYTVVSVSNHPGDPLAEDCIPVEVQPVSPPQLSWPSDTSVLSTPYPQFSWLPPLPTRLFSNLNYDLNVAEVKSGQTAYEALQQNIPVYNLHHATSLTDLYPASSAALDTGRVYCWQIVAKNGEDYIAQSEVWTFRIAPKHVTALQPSGGRYLTLRPATELSAGSQWLDGHVLGVHYYSFEAGGQTTVRIYSPDGKPIWSQKATLQYGDNYLVWDLGAVVQAGSLYTVVITDSKNTAYRAAFIVKDK
jgi:hypothetical protein